MNRILFALPVVAVLSLSACANQNAGDWTPVGVRTAGEEVMPVKKTMTTKKKKTYAAERAYSNSMQK